MKAAIIAQELQLESKFVSVSVEDIPAESWKQSMQQFADGILYVKPGM